MAEDQTGSNQSRYKALIEKVFFDRYAEGDVYVEFERQDLVAAAETLEIELPKNLGDVVYSIRYRTLMPDGILNLQPEGLEWIIEGTGRAKYVFKLVHITKTGDRPHKNRGQTLRYHQIFLFQKSEL